MIEHNAIIEIRYDTRTKKMRARYKDNWVRFPKKLRTHGNCYVVPELKQGKSGSWIACGQISKVEKIKCTDCLI